MTQTLPMRRIVALWWPLAASWLFMAAELPAISAVAARLADPKIHLAAYSGVVFPLILIIESPIIMLLSASTALSKDWASYRLIYRFMMITSAVLTGLHALVAFTPLYEPVARTLFGAPAEIVEPGRIGLMIMLPWTWTIAYRRFQQGLLIRFGQSRLVGVGTAVRLVTDGIVLFAGYTLKLPGIVVMTLAVASGITAEAIYAGIAVRPLHHPAGALRQAAPVEPALTLRAFLNFYFPLVMTSFIWLLTPPITSAAINRMPQAIASLAAWSPLTGLVFMLRSLGNAYNEVVVALLDEQGSSPNLRRFVWVLVLAGTAIVLFFVLTPFAGFWFGRLSALDSELAGLAVSGLWLALPLPALTVLQSWFQGGLMHARKTAGISESVVLYLVGSLVLLGGGVVWGGLTGLFVGVWAMLISTILQTFWLGWRARPVLQFIAARERSA
ncbi:MAG: hypothetical protein ACOYYS_00120 [Chloroflexota bacterium]